MAQRAPSIHAPQGGKSEEQNRSHCEAACDIVTLADSGTRMRSIQASQDEQNRIEFRRHFRQIKQLGREEMMKDIYIPR